MASIVLRPVPAPTGNAATDAANLAQFDVNEALGGWNPLGNTAFQGHVATDVGSTVVGAEYSILDAATSVPGPIQTLLGKLNLPTTGTAAQAVTKAAQAVGAVAPPATPSNPTAARTIFGLPVVDVVVGGGVLAAGAYLLRKFL